MRGWGVIFNPSIYIADFGPLNRAFPTHLQTGMWGRRKRGDVEGEGEHFYPLQHPKDRQITIMIMVVVVITFNLASKKFYLYREDAEILATILSQT